MGTVPTVLDQVMARIREIRALETVDIPVPHIDGLFLRCARVLDEADFTDAAKRYEASPVQLKAWLVAKTCIGIFVEEADGRKVGLTLDGSEDPASWPRFDRRLDPVLPDLPDDATAIDRVTALFTAGVHPDGQASVLAFGLGKVTDKIAELHTGFAPKLTAPST